MKFTGTLPLKSTFLNGIYSEFILQIDTTVHSDPMTECQIATLQYFAVSQ